MYGETFYDRHKEVSKSVKYTSELTERATNINDILSRRKENKRKKCSKTSQNDKQLSNRAISQGSSTYIESIQVNTKFCIWIVREDLAILITMIWLHVKVPLNGQLIL